MRVSILAFALQLASCSTDSNAPIDDIATEDFQGVADTVDIELADIPVLPDLVPDLTGPELPDLTDIGEELEVEISDLLDEEGSDEVLDTYEIEVVPPPEPISPVTVERTGWGGYADLKLADGTGFFATAVTDDRVWLVDPDGHAFHSMGIQAVSTGSLPSPALGYAPGKLAQWAQWAAEYGGWGAISTARLAEHLAAMVEHGFNTVGGWSGGYGHLSGHGIAYSVSLGFAGGTQTAIADKPIPAVSSGNFPDVFHPDFPAACLAYAQKSVSSAQASDPWNLGYYSDNELRWWGKDYFIISGTWTLADDYIDEAAGTPGKEAFVALMEAHYEGDVAPFNEVYGTALTEFAELSEVMSLPYEKGNESQAADRDAFIEAIADQYFGNVRTALKSVAPDHLYLCARFASVAPEPVIQMATKYCDVVTFNDYYILPDPISEMALGGTPEERWAGYGAIVTAHDPPRPIIVTEWGIRGDDSGLPNTFGAGFVVDTQFERSDFYRFSADWFLDHTANGLGFVAGWHWFMYIDEPPTGRFDGEDCNYGVVTLRDEKYRFIWEAMRAVNRWVDNRLVQEVEPSLLPPPAQVEAVAEVGGKAKVKWSAVPLATGYHVHVLSHPAGTEHRVVATHTLDTTEVLLDIAGYGLGTYWFGVEAFNDELLSLGPRVSNSVVAEASGYPNAPSQDDVLQCESLATVIYFNDFPLPNDDVGQTYVSSIPSFVEAGGKALRLEFLPSSLGYVTLSPAGETTFRIDIAMPEEVTVTGGDSLHLSIFPHVLVLTDQVVASATDVVWLSILDSDGEPLGQEHLATFDLEPNVAAEILNPLSMAGNARTIRFEVDLFEPTLPLESIVRLDLDDLIITVN